jgi:uncharacterized membrane-anchored protein
LLPAILLIKTPSDKYASPAYLTLSASIHLKKRLFCRTISVGNIIDTSKNKNNYKEDPNKVWIVDSVNMHLPASIPQDKMLIRGNAAFSQILYDIESYYIPEEKRGAIENDLSSNRDKTYAQIKVDKFGNAALVRLLIGDTVYEY